MSTRNVQVYLDDIAEAVSRIERYTAGLSADDFVLDQMIVDAVVRNLEIIGEAANRLPLEFRKKHDGVPWHAIIGMRNKVIHDYSGIDVRILWETVKTDLPPLKDWIVSVQSQRR